MSPIRIEKDKAERRSRGGTLSSVLGVDGYNPSAMSAQIAAEIEKSEGGHDVASAAPAKKSSASVVGGNPAQIIDKAVDTISKHKVKGRMVGRCEDYRLIDDRVPTC
jgi:hypothetical protein